MCKVVCVLQDVDEKELEKEIEQMAFSQMQESIDLEYRDDGYLKLVLKILGLMCDGQNEVLQDYLREQPDNIKSVNLVAETARFLALVYSSINKNTMPVVTELFQTLVEFASVSVHPSPSPGGVLRVSINMWFDVYRETSLTNSSSSTTKCATTSTTFCEADSSRDAVKRR